MGWGRAFLYAAGPALLVGPLSGVLGGVMALIAIAIADGNAGGAFGFTAIVALVVGLILGLLISTPICTIMGAVLLKLAGRREMWLHAQRWVLVGGASGLALGLLLSVALSNGRPEDLVPVLVLTAIAGFLGAVSAWLMRRRLQRRTDQLHMVDVSIFE